VSLCPSERITLLAAARSSVEAASRGSALPAAPSEGALGAHLGAFVTLRTKQGSELRGCIGCFTPMGTLGQTVVRMAAAAAVEDPRFPPVRPSEIGSLFVEISVLSPMKPARPSDVVPGDHGVYIRRGARSGTLLPQVAREEGWDRDQLLGHVCLKAGLPPAAWKSEGVELFTYTAEVFSEDRP